MSTTTATLLLAVALAWIAAGGVLFARRRHRLPGALAIATGAAVALGVAAGAAAEGRASQSALTVAGLLFGPLTLATYPGRRTLDRWNRTAVALIGACGLVGIVATWWSSDAWLTAAVLCGVLILGGHFWWRIERSDGEERHALAWACVGVVAAGAVLFVVGFVVPGAGTAGEVLALIAVCLIPASLVVGTRPRRVIDPRLVTVGGAVLIGAVMATMSVFVLLRALLEILAAPASDGALAVIAVIAATTFHPTRVRLRGVVDALLFGSRPDPLGAATQVASGVGHDPQAALETVRAAMVLPYAALEVDGSVVAVSGQAGATSTRRLSLPAGGELVVGLRPGDLGLPEDDERVLRLVAPLLSLTLQAHQLNNSLRESRTQTRAALEEERRRLRRDLHDGLGPQLSATTRRHGRCIRTGMVNQSYAAGASGPSATGSCITSATRPSASSPTPTPAESRATGTLGRVPEPSCRSASHRRVMGGGSRSQVANRAPTQLTYWYCFSYHSGGMSWPSPQAKPVRTCSP